MFDWENWALTTHLWIMFWIAFAGMMAGLSGIKDAIEKSHE